MSDMVEVVWVFRPDDPKRNGKRETLPADLAKMKVSEGLAKYAPAPAETVSDDAEGDKPTARRAAKDADGAKP